MHLTLEGQKIKAKKAFKHLCKTDCLQFVKVNA